MTGRSTLRWAPFVAAVSMALGATACSSESGSSGNTDDGAVTEPALEAIAAFYPLQFVAEEVGGDAVSVSNLTPIGAEPHELELSARDTARISDADLVLYLAGFAPALDDAIAGVDADALDVSDAATLTPAGHEEHDGDEHDEPGHDHGDEATDPHFWLDPDRLADVADAVADRFTELAPDHGADFARNAADLRVRLDALSTEYEAGLAECASRDLVTSHEAFGYLAERFGLHQIGIVGLSPDDEPTPAQLAAVADLVRDNGVRTVYYETLVDPAIAETAAAEAGVDTAVLDPLEGIDEDGGLDYVGVMRANLATLQTGQGCP